VLTWNDRSPRGPRHAFPAWAGPAERLRYLISWAIQAPSRHNTQPWIFEIEGAELRLFADPRRALRAADPQGREMAVACGAALENLWLAAAHFGHGADIEELAPRPGDPLLARLRLVERRRAGPEEERLFEAIPRRRTAFAFHPEPVPAAALSAIAAEAGGDALVRVLPSWLAPSLASLVAEADAAQWASGRYRAELATWTRSRGRPRADGLAPAPQHEARRPGGLLRRLLRRAGVVGRAETARRVAEQTRTLVLLSSPGDGPADWVRTGRALQRVLLRATAEGLHAGWYAAATEVQDVRRRLRRAVGDPGHPQVLLRLGYGLAPRSTPRRPVDLVVRSMVAEVAVDVAIADDAGQQAG
jgi:nitroreductase